MPRYYFHLNGPGTIVTDEEGLVLPDREAAWYQAVRSAREMIRAELHLGTSWEGQAIEIADDDGAPVAQVPLAEIARYAI
ncbi:MAG TPA: hypothetical protein VH331_00580 [Allosphingosinicella sp.]|jgi:hypothetical protein|nr:hypothetical protein [Allosphingosinicella sp.]